MDVKLGLSPSGMNINTGCLKTDGQRDIGTSGRLYNRRRRKVHDVELHSFYASMGRLLNK